MSDHPEAQTAVSHYLNLTSPSDVLAVLQAEGPQLLFLRDPTCPVSLDADEQISALGLAVTVVDVAAHTELGRLIEHETGIRHESPQAIVIRGGHPAWHASHYGITREAVTAAMQA